MTDAAPRTIEYGRPETQWGVTVEHMPDGGVVITVPAGMGNLPGGLAVAFQSFLSRVLPAWLAKAPPPRALLRLTAEGLYLAEPHAEVAGETIVRTWPLHEVGEVRLNRFGPGLYVQIPGRDNFDAFVDLPVKLVEFIAGEVEAALKRLRDPPMT